MWNTKQQEAIEFGNLLHELLSFITTTIDVESALEKAVETGLIAASEQKQVEESVNKIIFHPELEVFFNPKYTVMNEQTIVQKVGGLIKPDKIVLAQNNEAFLLDYKTGKELPKHQSQLTMYANALEEMGFSVTKKTLIYIGSTIKIIHL